MGPEISARHITTVLVANRGEIAVRVLRTLREMGIGSVAVYSDADTEARHVRAADVAVRIGPAPARESYLDIDRIIAAARRTGADAIHPGYGFLSENAAFARACAEAGIVFIGPPVEAIERMGDKIAAKNTVAAFEVPVVPGTSGSGLSDAELLAAAPGIGFPILVKPSAGGGGKGMRRVDKAAELPAALAGARREAAAAFGDDTLLLERFVLRPRHIEVQILADGHGNVIHLGERECSVQRRHQKVIEEAPSPLLDAAARARIGAAACATARSVDYVGAGTVEFIVGGDRPDEFFFMEMNTRLQVEHPVTEIVTGIDLVAWQIRVARGEKLTLAQDDIRLDGHAVEARVYAEDPARGFLPTGGTVLGLAEPSGLGVRVDSGLRVGTVVGSDYDPMLAKVIGFGANRAAALRGLDGALERTAVLGVTTNIEFLRFLLADPDVVAGQLDTGLLDRRLPDFAARPVGDETLIAATAYLWLRRWAAGSADRIGDPWDVPSGWRLGAPAPMVFRLTDGTREATVRVAGTTADATAQVDDAAPVPVSATAVADGIAVAIAGLRRCYRVAEDAGRLWIAADGAVHLVRELAADRAADQADAHGETDIRSPMPGTVISAPAESGATVAAGQPLVVVEAMKMEHTLTAPSAGIVEILVSQGDRVVLDQLLARVTADDTVTEKGATA
jgi:acetyl-CoA/propionyl-CoA carboxylase biotin carboxyl carrier protein